MLGRTAAEPLCVSHLRKSLCQNHPIEKGTPSKIIVFAILNNRKTITSNPSSLRLLCAALDKVESRGPKRLLAAAAAARTVQNSSDTEPPKCNKRPNHTSCITKTKQHCGQRFHSTEVASYQLHSHIAQEKFAMNLMTNAHQIVLP